MKKLTILTAVFLFINSISFGQNIEPAPANKAVIYFVRPSSLGFAINFTYFDSTQVIGKFNGPKYMRYECEPGTHLFWARSENRDFVRAEVEAGKVYFIEAVPKMGGIKAAVELVPVDPTDEKKMEKIIKLLAKKTAETFTQEELQTETKNFEDVIGRGLEKYKEETDQGKAPSQLKKEMHYSSK